MVKDPPDPIHIRRWKELEPLLDELLALPKADRDHRIEEVGAQDVELADALRRLISAGEDDVSFLETGLEAGALNVDGFLSTTAAKTSAIEAGVRIGPYRLIRHLGTGGMADVWLGQRDDAMRNQTVAIKILRPLIGSQAESRFNAEREILASLRHDGIAHILDAGSTDYGLAYIALEFIDGATITQYCEQHELGIERRLDLFLQACDAVAYAHTHLIVHRDLKPSNILVTRDGHVKLVDFGIAKLLDPATVQAHDAPLTRTGIFLMTPEYAAPEQVRGEVVTTATDVYALGVVLYELLANRRPFELEGLSPAEVERTICETEPGSLQHNAADIPSDLAIITMKALRKEPELRYNGVRALVEDISRYKTGRPIAARPATAGYQWRKFVERNRVVVTASFIVAGTLFAGILVSAWQANAAREEAARAQAVSTFLYRLFDDLDPDVNPGGTPSALDLLESGAAKVDQLQAGVRVDVDMRRILGELFAKLGEVEKGEAFLREAAHRARAGLGPTRTTHEIELALIQHLAEVGDPEQVEQIALPLLTEVEPPMAALIHTQLGTAMAKRGDYDNAEQHIKAALTTLEPGSAAFDAARMEFGNLLIQKEEWDAAEELLKAVAQSREVELGRNHKDVATVLWNLGELMLKTARFEEAETLHREILSIRRAIYPQGHPDIARSLSHVAAAIQRQGRFEEAGVFYAQAVDAWDDRFGRAHPALGEILSNLAALHYRLGDLESAIANQTEALQILNNIWGEQDDNIMAAGLNNLGVMYRELGNFRDADIYIRRALEMRRRLHGPDHATVGMSLANLGRLRLFQNNIPEAVKYSLDGLKICEAQLPPTHPAVLAAQMAAGGALAAQGKYADASPMLDTVAGAYERMLPAHDARLAETYMWRGIARSASDKNSAREDLQRALATFETVLGHQAPLTVRTQAALAAMPDYD